MKPRAFTKADIDYTTKLIVAMLTRYPEQTKGYNMIVVGEEGSDQIEIGYNYIITSELEPVPSILPRKDWREQQVYRVTAMWEVYCPHTGGDVAEKDLGTFRSITHAVSGIMLDIVEMDLVNICEGVDYPDTPVLEEV